MRGEIKKAADGNHYLHVEGCRICHGTHGTLVEVIENRFELDGIEYLCWTKCPSTEDYVILLRHVNEESCDSLVLKLSDARPRAGIYWNAWYATSKHFENVKKD